MPALVALAVVVNRGRLAGAPALRHSYSRARVVTAEMELGALVAREVLGVSPCAFFTEVVHPLARLPAQ
jgi:hypothetical protein